MVDMLIRKNADVNAVTNIGYSPLLFATMNNHEIVALFLIQMGADVNQKTEDTGSTPLHYAAWHGSTKNGRRTNR